MGPVRLRAFRGGLECLFRVRDVAVRLSLSTATVRRMIQRGELAGIRLSNNSVRVRPEDLEAYLHRSQG